MHAATTGTPVAPAAAQIAAPFGDASTRSGTAGARSNEAGDSDHGWSGLSAARRTATAAPSRSAYADAWSPHGNGCTRVPRPTATSSAAVKDNTSITTRTAQGCPRSAAPANPHSKPAPLPGCEFRPTPSEVAAAETSDTELSDRRGVRSPA